MQQDAIFANEPLQSGNLTIVTILYAKAPPTIQVATNKNPMHDIFI